MFAFVFSLGHKVYIFRIKCQSYGEDRPFLIHITRSQFSITFLVGRTIKFVRLFDPTEDVPLPVQSLELLVERLIVNVRINEWYLLTNSIPPIMEK